MAYSGGLCSAVFVSDPVNISNQGSAFLTVANTTTYGQIFEGFQLFYGNSIYSQSCLEYLRFLLCLYLYKACPGYVWCGPYPKDALKDAVANTCGCTDTYSCIIINFLNASSVIEKGYFEGSSSTGLVGGGESQCRDIVTGKIWQWFHVCIYVRTICINMYVCRDGGSCLYTIHNYVYIIHMKCTV